jgi:hypothetical protein
VEKAPAASKGDESLADEAAKDDDGESLQAPCTGCFAPFYRGVEVERTRLEVSPSYHVSLSPCFGEGV